MGGENIIFFLTSAGNILQTADSEMLNFSLRKVLTPRPARGHLMPSHSPWSHLLRGQMKLGGRQYIEQHLQQLVSEPDRLSRCLASSRHRGPQGSIHTDLPLIHRRGLECVHNEQRDPECGERTRSTQGSAVSAKHMEVFYTDPPKCSCKGGFWGIELFCD